MSERYVCQGEHNESTSSAELVCILPQEIKCLEADLQAGTVDRSPYKTATRLTLPYSSASNLKRLSL